MVVNDVHRTTLRSGAKACSVTPAERNAVRFVEGGPPAEKLATVRVERHGVLARKPPDCGLDLLLRGIGTKRPRFVRVAGFRPAAAGIRSGT